MFYSATIHWEKERDENCRRFMTSSFSLTLDGETSFLRIIDVRNKCKRLCYSQIYLRDSSVQWRKVGRI